MKVFLLMGTFLATRWTQTFATHSYSSEEVEYEDGYLKILMDTFHGGRPRNYSADAGDPLILTKYIEEHRLKEGRDAARVDAAAFGTELESYAGYFTVNKDYNANLFMWYFPVMEGSIEETPFIIWLQGGPGGSSLYGLFNEIGPFRISENGILEKMPYSWASRHSLLFIDNPVGSGYSFTDDHRGYTTNQTTIGENLYDALQQFLTIFPELRKAPLTIAGESYAGKHIPSLAIQIHRNRENNRPINLYGLAIGNGWIDPKTLLRCSYAAREVGLVKDSVADKMRAYEKKARRSIVRKQLKESHNHFGKILATLKNESGLNNVYNYLKDQNMTQEELFVEFTGHDNIRKALHVGNTNFSQPFVVYDYLYNDFMNSAKPWLEELIQNYKVMSYNGHLDLFVAYHAAVYTYYSLKFPGSRCFKNARRFPWYHAGKIAGWRRTVGNFTDMMIRGSGHMVPMDKPAAAEALIYAFSRGLPLDEDTALAIGDAKYRWTQNFARQSESELLDCSSEELEHRDSTTEELDLLDFSIDEKEHEDTLMKILMNTYG